MTRWVPQDASLLPRTLTALVALPLLLLAVWAGAWWLTLMVVAAALLGLREFYALGAGAGARPVLSFGLLWTASLVVAGSAYGQGVALLVMVVGALGALLWVLARRDRQDAFSAWAFTVAGPVYLGITLLHAVFLRQDYGVAWLLLALLATFATDTSAYFVGRSIGRHRMAPSISPGKTWEGAAGGLVGAVAAAVALGILLHLEMAWWWVAVLGAGIGVVAQLGDLSESMLKRGAQAKEAGHLIPGHGGVLDRVDSLVFTMVLVYYVLRGVLS
ncbi:MAG: phosphatidate cytidylyltransferase [Chloroflexi bacterium]|nr:phosphatidate cytidylyltransferase [Chloroflexota bacterium]